MREHAHNGSKRGLAHVSATSELPGISSTYERDPEQRRGGLTAFLAKHVFKTDVNAYQQQRGAQGPRRPQALGDPQGHESGGLMPLSTCQHAPYAVQKVSQSILRGACCV